MATVARRRLGLSRFALPPLDGRAATLVLLALLMGASLYLRTRALGAPFWIDEGLSVGIASHALLDIPGVLEQDGSPPFYYMLLHVWIDVFGDSEEATKALSVVFAMATVPLAFWLGSSLFGRRAGWFCALLAAVNPFLTSHGQETRMYGVMVFLSLFAVGAFLQAFVRRRRGWLIPFSLLLALMLYTHNWSWFFTAGSLLALGWLAWRADAVLRRRLLRDGALAYGGALLLYAPWIPTLVDQAQHTGAPWSKVPLPDLLPQEIASTLGGPGPAIAILLAGGGALWAVLREGAPRERRLLGSLALLLLVALLSAWAASQVEPAWANRYFAVLVGPLLLLAGACLSRAGGLGVAALLVVLVFTGQPHGYSAGAAAHERDVIEEVSHRLEPGDLVISTHPERTAVLHYYLPEGMRYASTLGPVEDPRVMDWRDAQERLRSARPAETLDPLLDTVPVGARILFVRPLIRSDAGWDAPWTRLVRHRSMQWARRLAGDARFVRVDREPVSTREKLRGVRAFVYEKRNGG